MSGVESVPEPRGWIYTD